MKKDHETKMLSEHQVYRRVDHVPVLDPVVFRDFLELLGKSQAHFWLDSFCKNLLAEFQDAEQNSAIPSREAVHHICGRAGIIGFTKLHELCLEFLEVTQAPVDRGSIHQRLRSEAQRVIAEIERQNALLD